MEKKEWDSIYWEMTRIHYTDDSLKSAMKSIKLSNYFKRRDKVPLIKYRTKKTPKGTILKQWLGERID